MNRLEDIRKYMDSEGFVPRDALDIWEMTASEKSSEDQGRLLPLFQEISPDFRIDDNAIPLSKEEFYSLSSEMVKGIPLIDHIKARRKKGFVKTIYYISGLIPEGRSRILDWGCGTGLELVYLAKTFPGLEGVGLDSSKGRIDFARNRASRYDLGNLEFHEIMGEEYETTSRFDNVLFLHSLGYTPINGSDPKKTMISQAKRARELLNPRGLVTVTFSCGTPLTGTLEREEHAKMIIETISEGLEDTGYKDVSHFTIGETNAEGFITDEIIINGRNSN